MVAWNSVRALVRNLIRANAFLGIKAHSEPVPPLPRLVEFRRFLLSLDMPDEAARRYLEIHVERLALSLALLPAPQATSRVLELGAYMHMTPALHCVLGYREVIGGYLGTLGDSTTKTATVGGAPVFECRIDHFNAELDRYPYPDASFDCVVACEIFEHFLHDPMHMIAEASRILVIGGALLVTTPNITSATAVARDLEQSGNPQLYSKYANPQGLSSLTEVGHMREYTPAELREALECAGFEVVQLFTRNAPGYTAHQRIVPLLQLLGYSTNFRGEQMFCLARKTERGVTNHYPAFLYEAG